MRKLLLVTLSFLISVYSFGQAGQGAISATVSEAGNGLPIPFANVAVKQNGSLVTGGSTDFDGKVEIKPISPGTYDLEITSLGFAPIKITSVQVTTGKTTFVPKSSSKMKSSAIQLDDFVVIEYKKPLIEKDGAATQETVTAEEIGRMAARSPAQLAATVGGSYSKDNGSGNINIRGARSDANYYYIDGIKVRGSSSIPQSAIEQLSVIQGGIPAQYGDVTGGVVNITIKPSSDRYEGGFEYLTSGVKLGEDGYVGLDPYGYNLLEFNIRGPLVTRKDSAGNKESLLGFMISGNFNNSVENRPSAVGNWKIKDDVLAALKEDPLREGFAANSVIPNSDYLRINDFERVRVRPNVGRTGANLAAKFDVSTTETTDLTFGGTMFYRVGNRYDYEHSLLDYESYPQETTFEWKVYSRFTQRFKNATAEEEEQSASLIKNAYYSIQADYSQEYFKRQNEELKDDFMKYGHIGTFKTYQSADYAVGTDSITGIFGNIQQTFLDTLITFQPSESNPELARFTQRYFELNGWEGFDEEGNPIYDRARSEAFSNYNNIQSGGGLINGDNLDGRSRSVYGMWVYNNDITNARGGATDSYFEQFRQQVRVSGQGSADIGDHQFIVGFEYEQRVDRAYSLSPRGLWTAARLRANTHVSERDFANPIIEYPGPSISYPRLNASPGEYNAEDPNEAQSFIDYNLRKSIGLNPDGVDFLDVYSLDPESIDLEFFSADELYNGGNSYVSYYGYDPYGNRSKSNPSFNDFFTERDEFGNLTRPIAPFAPIYVAGYIEDKFEFDDLIFRIGVRVDRYDANQQVLKDPFVLFPTFRARDDQAVALLEEGVEAHPSNIGDDYVVYVDDITNPTSILGYRDGRTWYNAEGAELTDASALRVSNGLPAPYLQNSDQQNSVDIREDSFEDYKPQTQFMPRVAFSFPISDEANFYAHYDVLTKRPTFGQRLNPSDYYFLESRASTARLDNPNLQPERTVDYEVGFQQALTNSMALKIAAFYKEQRNMVTATRVFDSYPIEYVSVDNLDFSTVKVMTLSYDLRSTNNLAVRASYTLQFAEGTGSNSTSQLNLARSGQPNLRAPIRLSFDQRHALLANIDYRYKGGESYNGPIIGNKRILEKTGVNLQLRAGSGDPYNPQSNFNSRALFTVSPASLQKGSVNGASLPWKFRFDATLDRDFVWQRNEDSREIGINVYFQIFNLLNARNWNAVYRATGNPDDDGYLNSAIGQVFVDEQNSPNSFVEYYTLKLWNPNNWELPRRIRLGVRVNF